MATELLKHDVLGSIHLVDDGGTAFVERDARAARSGVRWLARLLAAREAAGLERLTATPGVPRLLAFDGWRLRRSYLKGKPLFLAPLPSRRYFARALRLLRVLHRAGVAHNDLAKEANWLIGPGETPGIVDFQVATRSTRRSKWFRNLAYEDLRHLLKHKRTYQPHALTARQHALLAAPSTATRLWRVLGKPLYRLITRRALGWPERSGPAERQRR
jgi:hypothetical protein